MTNFIAIDASIHSTGVAIQTWDNKIILFCFTDKSKTNLKIKIDNIELIVIKIIKKDYKNDFERFNETVNLIIKTIKQYVTDDCKIYLEGYSYASSGMVFKIAEFTGLVKTRLYDMGYITDSIPPTEWKKSVTGRGNATKDIIYKHMLGNDKGMSEIISHLVADGIKYKKGCWLEDVVDSYAILKYIIQNI